MFIPKTFAQILSSMVSFFVGQTVSVTDFNQGSVARSLMEAAAMEIERAYMQTYEGLLDAIDTSLYTAFNFGLLPAQAAYGAVRLTRVGGYAPDINIPSGTKFQVPGTTKTYTVPVTQVWAGGAVSTTFDVTSVADVAGIAGNTPASSITQITLPITGVASASNPQAFVTGYDAETTDQRKQRFAAYVASLPRGTTNAIEFGAKTTQILDLNGFATEQVRKAHAITTGAGTASLYIHNGIGTVGGQTTTAALTTACQVVINGTATVPGYRAAGVTVSVINATEVDTAVKVVITSLFDGYTIPMVQGAAVQAVKDLIDSLNMADTLRVADITTAIRNVPGVRDCQVVTPGANVTATDAQLNVSSSVLVSRFTLSVGGDASL